MIIGHRPAGQHRQYLSQPPSPDAMAGQAEPQSYIELRGNRIGLKALLLGGRKHPEQWGVHERNTSKFTRLGLLVFLSMPLREAFKPHYIRPFVSGRLRPAEALCEGMSVCV
jgi:hypothetical protein